MNESALHKIYNEYINNGCISMTKLFSMGFSKVQLDILFKKRILKYVDNNLVVNSNDLLLYCKEYLIKDETHERRINCYKAILNSEPLNRIAVFQLFIEYASLANYKIAYKYLDMLFSISEEPYLNDCNYYLHLMSIIEKVPEQYQTLKNYVWDMNVKDTLYSYEAPYNKKYIDAINKIRETTFRENYTYAFSQYNDLTKDSYLFGRDFISKILLFEVIDIYKTERDTINDTILNDKSLECLNCINDIEQKHPLSVKLNSIRYLLLLIYKMLLTNRLVPYKVKKYNGKNAFSSILTGNIENACELNYEYINKYNIQNDIHDKLLKIFMRLTYELTNYNSINYCNDDIQPLIKDALLYKCQKLGYKVDDSYSKELPNIYSYEELQKIINRIDNRAYDRTRKLVKNEN